MSRVSPFTALIVSAIVGGCSGPPANATYALAPSGHGSVSRKCKEGERLVASNNSKFPVELVVAVGVFNSGPNKRLGPLLPGETDTLAVDAQLERVAAYPDSAHQLRGPWGQTLNHAKVVFRCVSTALGG